MNVAKTIADIELLEHIFTLPDNRPVSDGRLEGGDMPITHGSGCANGTAAKRDLAL
jgi:hypothetical protein